MIKTEKLTKVFRTEDVETLALCEVDVHVKKGEFVAIMGPSGCGKSTLLNIVGLLDNLTEGTYSFDGNDITHLKEKDRTQYRKGNIGFIFQSFNLIDELNVFDNVELPLIYLKMKASERRKKVDDVLKRMKIGHRAKHFPQQLSGGQQQRVAIARAVVANPGLILADEPTGNLDSKNGIEVMNLLSELNQEGTTIIMVTHSDRIYAGTNASGLWKTIDGGENWFNVTDVIGLPGMGVNDVVMDPYDTDILYICTGVTTFQRGYGVGIWKSTDAGNSWMKIDRKQQSQHLYYHDQYLGSA